MAPNKSLKRSTKRQASKSSLGNYHLLEKEFMGIPGKFAAQVKKDIAAQKQKENKIKAAWSKSKKNVKVTEAKLKAALKNKTSAAGKKLVKNTKQVYAKVVSSHSTLEKQLKEITDALATLTAKHSKLTALSKHLNLFNKEWAKNSKQTPAQASTRKTRRKSQIEKSSFPAEERSDYESPAATYGETEVTDTETTT